MPLLEDVGLVGNGQYAAHIATDGDVVWCCLPRFDAEPVLSRLLDAARGGRFQVGPAAGGVGRQHDLDNTNVLVTEFDDGQGAFRVIDFAPRFEQHQRAFHPTQLFRVVEPIRGTPRVQVRCEPVLGWSGRPADRVLGSNHVRFEGYPAPLRLTTDVPLSYLGGQPFALTGRRHLALTWGAPIEEPLPALADRFLAETTRYWRRWVEGCDIPAAYQAQVIQGNGPVRTGNGAASHRQHDVYGETALSLVPVFLDERFRDERSDAALDLVVRLARKAVQVAGTPDAGIWEYRSEWTPQTFSTLMSWVAADRVAMVLERRTPGAGAELAGQAARLHAEILERCWRPDLQAFAASYRSSDLDASLLLMVPLRFLPQADPRLGATVDAIAGALGRGDWLDRYRHDDGFGTPKVAFVLCTFWLVQALAGLGRHDEARRRLEATFAALSPLGLLSEDFDPRTGRLWGNFPQAYSHVGLIHAAFDASPRWPEIL